MTFTYISIAIMGCSLRFLSHSFWNFLYNFITTLASSTESCWPDWKFSYPSKNFIAILFKDGFLLSAGINGEQTEESRFKCSGCSIAKTFKSLRRSCPTRIFPEINSMTFLRTSSKFFPLIRCSLVIPDLVSSRYKTCYISLQYSNNSHHQEMICQLSYLL